MKRLTLAFVGFAALSAACGRPPEPQRTPAAASPKPVTHDDTLRTLADRGRIEGDSAAPIWIIDASDFQCPYCADWQANTHEALRAEYVRTGKAKIAFVNFPLEQHTHAMPAARAAMCAGVQGRFWPVHDGIFAAQERWSAAGDASPLFESIARTAGVRIDEWKRCIASGAMDPLIIADRERAISAGVGSTPTFIIAGQLIRGAAPIEEFRRVIDAALAAQP
ncbi:MAG TPA: thioredoxin domain-containing protein [Gemmatimonadaceae bacterium]|nr:thioredoxin domain-containing protein [Gemmatimonadaceae bacterium]